MKAVRKNLNEKSIDDNQSFFLKQYESKQYESTKSKSKNDVIPVNYSAVHPDIMMIAEEADGKLQEDLIPNLGENGPSSLAQEPGLSYPEPARVTSAPVRYQDYEMGSTKHG